MDLRETLQRMLRIILTYIAVIMILLVCICVGLWSFIGTPLLNLIPFQRRRNVSSIEFNDGTSEDEHLTSPKSTTPSSDDTASKRTSTFSDPTETGNTEKEMVPEKSNQISTKEIISSLEGLALQMAQLEQDIMSTDMSPLASSSSSEFSVRSPNESLSVKPITPKSVLKSSCSEIKTSPNRGTRRIRFQDAPTYEVCTGSSTSISRKESSHSSSCSKQRRISPAPYLKADLSFSPAVSSETKICTTDKITRNVPKINLSSETASDQQVKAKIDHLSEKSNISIPTSFSSETADNQHMSNKSMEHLLEESPSTTELTSEITSNQQVKNESTDYLSNESKLSNLSVLPAKITDQQESNEPIDSLSEELSSNPTVLSYYETATNQPTAKYISFLSKESNNTVPAACKELEESAQVGDQCFEQEIIESAPKFKSNKLLSEHASQEISTQVKQKKDGELLCESSGKDVLSIKEKESFRRDIEDIHQFTEDSIFVDSLQVSSPLPESAICQQTAEVMNENQDESTSTNELNPTIYKTDEELCKSLKSEYHFQQEDTESITVADRRQTSRGIITQRIKKRNVEELRDHSSEETDRISSSEEDLYFKIEESKLDVSQALKTVDFVVQSEDSTNQQSADESTYL